MQRVEEASIDVRRDRLTYVADWEAHDSLMIAGAPGAAAEAHSELCKATA